jgi:hypothetical protein
MEKPRAVLSAFCTGLALMLALSIAPTAVRAIDTNPVIGDWEGTMDPGAQAKKRIVVHITAAQDGSLGGSIDFPDQDTSGIQMTAITYKGLALHFESTPSMIVYDGNMNKDKLGITGNLKQAGSSLTLVLTRTP